MDKFVVKDCALAAIATGSSASSLYELKEIIGRIPTSSLYHHFWGGRLRPSFAHPDYHNDFATWAHFSLHDNILSERLNIIDPTEFATLDEMRQILMEIIENRLDEMEYTFWSKSDAKFHFLRSIIVVFDTSTAITHPRELKGAVPMMATNSIFYHFIDARRRTEKGIDDFTFWLSSFDDQYKELIADIAHIDPYFLDLASIKNRLIEIINKYLE